MMKNLTDDILRTIKRRLMEDKSVIVTIVAPTGCGMSYSALVFAKQMEKVIK